MRIETCSAHYPMSGRRITFNAAGLPCVAERHHGEWTVTVGNAS